MSPNANVSSEHERPPLRPRRQPSTPASRRKPLPNHFRMNFEELTLIDERLDQRLHVVWLVWAIWNQGVERDISCTFLKVLCWRQNR